MLQKCSACADAIMSCERGLGRAAACGGGRLINYRFIFKLGLIKHYSSLISASGTLPTWAISVLARCVSCHVWKRYSDYLWGTCAFALYVLLNLMCAVCQKLEARWPINHFTMSTRGWLFYSVTASFIHVNSWTFPQVWPVIQQKRRKKPRAGASLH